MWTCRIVFLLGAWCLGMESANPPKVHMIAIDSMASTQEIQAGVVRSAFNDASAVDSRPLFAPASSAVSVAARGASEWLATPTGRIVSCGIVAVFFDLCLLAAALKIQSYLQKRQMEEQWRQAQRLLLQQAALGRMGKGHLCPKALARAAQGWQ
mmetsp:Transcript_38795/g.101429  ORF Transcript_38795/g.101429 Transcript_38795/m.101429 type:complete len:154 (-) Transcript_38795:239-700(-)